MISPATVNLAAMRDVELRRHSDAVRPDLRLCDDLSRVRKLYDGPAGGLLAIGSVASLHQPLLGRLMRRGDLDLSSFRHVLDVGTGAGQILKHLVKLTPPETAITACDLSEVMLHRAKVAISRSQNCRRSASDFKTRT